METVLFLAADYANHETSGKLNILGIFNRIFVRGFPARHRTLYLVIRVAAALGEYDTKHDLKIVFYDEDGHELGAQNGELLIPRPDSGKQAQADLIIGITDLLLTKPGTYEFRLIINKDLKGSLPIDVILMKEETESD